MDSVVLGDTAIVPLRKRGEVVDYVLVDPADLDRLSVYRWGLHSRGYAVALPTINGKQRTILMHRFLLGLEQGDTRQGDHKNLDRLDNRRDNLRIVNSQAENLQNVPARTGRYRGVSYFPQTGRWKATCQIRGKNNHLGYFMTEEEAGAVAAAYRREHMPLALN